MLRRYPWLARWLYLLPTESIKNVDVHSHRKRLSENLIKEMRNVLWVCIYTSVILKIKCLMTCNSGSLVIMPIENDSSLITSNILRRIWAKYLILICIKTKKMLYEKFFQAVWPNIKILNKALRNLLSSNDNYQTSEQLGMRNGGCAIIYHDFPLHPTFSSKQTMF